MRISTRLVPLRIFALKKLISPYIFAGIIKDYPRLVSRIQRNAARWEEFDGSSLRIAGIHVIDNVTNGDAYDSLLRAMHTKLMGPVTHSPLSSTPPSELPNQTGESRRASLPSPDAPRHRRKPSSSEDDTPVKRIPSAGSPTMYTPVIFRHFSILLENITPRVMLFGRIALSCNFPPFRDWQANVGSFPAIFPGVCQVVSAFNRQ